MSKVFEKEYIKLAQSEIPDLWDRIEAGLSEKNPVLTAEHEKSAAGIPMDTVSTPITINEEANKETKQSVVIFFRRYQTVAAALLCVMILIPAFMLMRQIGSGGSSDESAAADMAMETEMEAAPAEMMETTEAAAEETMEMATAAEEALSGNVPDADRNTLAEKAEAEAAMKDEMAEQKQSSENKAAANVLYQVSLEIIQEQENIGSAEADTISGTLYKCIVLRADEGGQLREDEEITVLVPKLLAEEVSEGERYEFDLTESDSEYYDYVAKSLY